jgi:deoxyribonuclease (pyrimidine dimer)
MTRINLVSVKDLMDQHLLAEHREITRLPKNLQTSLNRKSGPLRDSEIPPSYVLGTGHVKFFMDKFQWLENRFKELTDECIARGFNITHRDETIFRNVPSKYYNEYSPTLEEIKLNKSRIDDRINEKPDFYKFWSKNVKI